jgi:hypothetical protein
MESASCVAMVLGSVQIAAPVMSSARPIKSCNRMAKSLPRSIPALYCSLATGYRHQVDHAIPHKSTYIFSNCYSVCCQPLFLFSFLFLSSPCLYVVLAVFPYCHTRDSCCHAVTPTHTSMWYVKERVMLFVGIKKSIGRLCHAPSASATHEAVSHISHLGSSHCKAVYVCPYK